MAEVPERDQAERLQGGRRAAGGRPYGQGDRPDRPEQRTLRDGAVRRPPHCAERRRARHARARHRGCRLLLVRDVLGGGRTSRDRRGRTQRAARAADGRARGRLDAARDRTARGRERAAVPDPRQRRRVRDRSRSQRARVGAGQCRRQGGRHARRSAAARVGMVEPHALADPARGDRGRAVRAPRRAGPAGARPAPSRVHDPRPSV